MMIYLCIPIYIYTHTYGPFEPFTSEPPARECDLTELYSYIYIYNIRINHDGYIGIIYLYIIYVLYK